MVIVLQERGIGQMFGVDDAIMAPIAGAATKGTFDILGSLLGGTNNHAGRDQRQATSYAIQASVLDKVAAAKKAGISPLYALGAPVMSASSAVGEAADNPLGRALSDMGQDVGRAVAATQSAAERQLQTLTLQKAGLENDYLRAQIASINSRTAQQMGPARPAIDLPADFGTLTPGGKTTAQDVQNEYGDIAENLFGLGHVTEDGIRSFYHWAFDPSYWNKRSNFGPPVKPWVNRFTYIKR